MLSCNTSGFVRLGETHLGEWPSSSAIAANCTGSKPPCQPSSTHCPRRNPPTLLSKDPPCFQLPSCFTQCCTAFPHSVRALFIHSIFDPRFLIPSQTTQRHLPPRGQRETRLHGGGHLPAFLAERRPASRNPAAGD